MNVLTKRGEIKMVEIKNISIEKLHKDFPETGWHESVDIVSKCLLCDFLISHRKEVYVKIEKCPYCGFKMTKVEKIGLRRLGDKAIIMTDPN